VKKRHTESQRFHKLLRMDEVEIVGGGMVLGERPPDAPHQAADGKIKSRRAILPLIVTVRGELQNLVGLATVLENMSRCAVDLGISPPAFFVVKSSRVSDTGQYQPMPYGCCLFLIACQPRDSTDGSGNKQNAIRITKIFSHQHLCQSSGHGQSGKIVVGQRRMTGV